ncbi:alpha/beta-hydrolase [Periconia macrospinosa]|uniref:Alpha/beta-hydrolase n=1 Tax=Periconia macrospinosa TaxID=97972 RepID=A0A2V1E3R7_9PLEO|nr:alpha/beta-hydrolase [Periconia macrospinosa]
MPNPSFTLDTEHGLISITCSAPKTSKPTLLLIHGNSSSSEIFQHIQNNESISSSWHILTFDLPGHGASSNAPDPERSYTMRGYASLALTILTHLEIRKVVVLGWSLGGHIGIELLHLLRPHPTIQMKGLMITGTPPALGKEQTSRGFSFQDPHLSFAARRDWTLEEAQTFARTGAGAPFEPWMEKCAVRTHGRARSIMWADFADREAGGVDQVAVVEQHKDVLIAVVNGADEPFVNLDYLDEIKWGNLWKGECLRLKGLKHAPFWEEPETFEKILQEFLEDCLKVGSTGVDLQN